MLLRVLLELGDSLVEEGLERLVVSAERVEPRQVVFENRARRGGAIRSNIRPTLDKGDRLGRWE